MLHCPVTDPLSLSFCTVMCSLVSEWLAASNPQSLICFYKLLNFWQPWPTEFSSNLSSLLLKVLRFSVLFAKYSAFRSLRRTFWSSLYSKLPLFYTIPCKLLEHQKACFVFFWLLSFCRTKRVSLIMPVKKRPTLYHKFYLQAQYLNI